MLAAKIGAALRTAAAPVTGPAAANAPRPAGRDTLVLAGLRFMNHCLEKESPGARALIVRPSAPEARRDRTAALGPSIVATLGNVIR